MRQNDRIIFAILCAVFEKIHWQTHILLLHPHIRLGNSATDPQHHLSKKTNKENNISGNILAKICEALGLFARKCTPTTIKKTPPCAPSGAAPAGAGRARSPIPCRKGLEKCYKGMGSSKLKGPFKAFHCL